MRLRTPFRFIVSMTDKDYAHYALMEQGTVEYDVQFIHQNHINLCGDASVQMLIMFLTKNTTVQLKIKNDDPKKLYLAKNPRGIFEGTNDDDLKRMLHIAGLNTWNVTPLSKAWDIESVRMTLHCFGPYIQSTGMHWVLVTGVDRQDVIYQDPWRGRNMSKKINDWMKFASNESDSVVAASTTSYIQLPAGAPIFLQKTYIPPEM